MHHTLICHPDTPARAITALRAAVSRENATGLLLHYILEGGVKHLVPSPFAEATQRRADDLWQHTCFEAFVKPQGGEAYLEFNVAPALDWQAYALDGYREGRRPADIPQPPKFERVVTSGRLELRARFEGLPPAAWRLALTAVVAERDGTLSYWALRHAPGKPDFHHPDGFALELP